jgi:hypothetical protein
LIREQERTDFPAAGQFVTERRFPSNGIPVIHYVLAIHINRMDIAVGVKEESSSSRDTQDEHTLVKKSL